MGSGRPISNYEAATYYAEGFFDVIDVRAITGIAQSAHGAFAQAQAFGKYHLGHALAPHGRIEGQLGGNDCGNCYRFLPGDSGAWDGDVFSHPHVYAQRNGQRVFGQS